ncbi:hypothetical protein [Cohnella ginsengisoli]|uniref:hypothetical protein n=1 Tax=Cohnella ginsengisoli TaxID=425004 RepID=UPI003B8A7234
MTPIARQVPFGYEPPANREKGTLIYYDTFEDTTDEALVIAAETAKARSFARFVLYPIHEETARRMSKAQVSAYYKREKRLAEWAREREEDEPAPELDRWEGKRKKVHAYGSRAAPPDGDAARAAFRLHDAGYRQSVRFLRCLRRLDLEDPARAVRSAGRSGAEAGSISQPLEPGMGRRMTRFLG